MTAMPPRFIRVLAICALACVAMCCAHAVTVRVTEADGARVEVTLSLYDGLRVELPSQPAAGLQWSQSGPKPAPLERLAATQRVFGGRLSNQGTSSFAWKAVSAGDGDLTLNYGSPAVRTAHPERTMRLHITVTPDATAAAPPADVLSEMEQVGTFQSRQPCGDCSALQETLTLYRSPGASPFISRRRYIDAPGGTLTSISSGTWSETKGTADSTSTIYQLSGPSVAYLLRVDGDRLIPLDAQQVPFPSAPGFDNAFHKLTQR